MVIKEGGVAWLPTGFLYVIHHLQPTIGMRWGFFPAWSGEAARCRKVTVAAMEAFPGMKGSVYDEWNSFLAANADKPAV